MRNFYQKTVTALLIFVAMQAHAQTPPAGGFGGFQAHALPKEAPATEQQLKRVSEEITRNVQSLMARGLLGNPISLADTVKFDWPLRQAAGFSDPGYYGISNYIDWNPAANAIKDFNCGSRTYDGHRGTDIFTFPFGWEKMDQNAVEVIAGADGVIVGKYDGNADTSCANCDPNLNSCQWNAVYVRSNIDGTIAWYGHLKKNSATVKNVGDAVVKGEYLGVVGSSGNSTGPHLHFEVWLNGNYNYLYEPWAGTCNLDGNSSLWANQQPYYNPGIIKVATASGIPQFSDCYKGGLGDKSLYKNTFSMNEYVYLPVFVRDNLVGKSFRLKVIRPNGSVQWDWSLAAFNNYYAAAYFYYYYLGNNFNVPGVWKYQVTYENSTSTHEFTMTAALPLNLLSFTGSLDGKANKLEWRTSDEEKFDRFELERSATGVQFDAIGIVKSKPATTAGQINDYQYNDLLPMQGENLYRLKMIDKNGQFSYSDIVNLKVPRQTQEDIRLLSNPAKAELRFVCANDYKQAAVKLVDQLGRDVLSRQMMIRKNQQVAFNISQLPTGIYYLVIDGQPGKLTRVFVKE